MHTTVNMSIEISEQFEQALDAMESTNDTILIAGRAGTGKTTLLNYFHSTTKKNLVILAPTGTAAVDIGGQTIHSFFKIFPQSDLRDVKKRAKRDLKNNTQLYKTIRKLSAIVIDEISMVRADLLDMVDTYLKITLQSVQPFGGMQMIFFGDLYQLAPVLRSEDRKAFDQKYASPYFFDSQVMKSVLEHSELKFFELSKIYRQKDKEFVEILNSIRNRTITEKGITELNKRVLPTDFEAKIDVNSYIFLTSMNDMASEINLAHIEKLSTQAKTYTAYINGKFEQNSFPTEEILILKPQARIMMLYNDPQGRWINGTLGTITKVKSESIEVKLDNGETYEVQPHIWEITQAYFDEKTSTLKHSTVGTFIQIPVRLAWAITIHKSQGKTFEKVIVDLGRGSFAVGQTYVALSRCTTLDGLNLKRPVHMSDIRVDYRVQKFLTQLQYGKQQMTLEQKLTLIENAIKKKLRINITYLKSTDEKSERTIEPHKAGEMEYLGKAFYGVEAYCHKSCGIRVFNIDKILDIKTP